MMVARSTMSPCPAGASTACTQRRVSVCRRGLSCSARRPICRPWREASPESVIARHVLPLPLGLRKRAVSCVCSACVQQGWSGGPSQHGSRAPSAARAAASAASPGAPPRAAASPCARSELLTRKCLSARDQQRRKRGVTLAKELIVDGQWQGGSRCLRMTIHPRVRGHSGCTRAAIASHIMSVRTQKGGYLNRAVSRIRRRSSPGW
mmetsp:Transcript_15173/g.51240  ORF Transcript_15173/g.51240 Transcript_15173/m.51240 type:complete len:207 (+) Transcript_15173:487-1107(+)